MATEDKIPNTLPGFTRVFILTSQFRAIVIHPSRNAKKGNQRLMNLVSVAGGYNAIVKGAANFDHDPSDREVRNGLFL